MDEQEVLIQRFIDRELSAEERVRFLQAVDEDPALRRQWLMMELIVAEAAQLPRLAPSPQFVKQVRARVARTTPGLWSRVREFVTAPHVATWNVAGAALAASLAALVVWGALRLSSAPDGGRPGSATAVPIAATAEQREPTVFVRLVLLHPQARSVSVAGDFNGWNPAQTPLERVDGGMWTTTIPLKPGRYQYMFVIDGVQWMADPLAPEEAGDGFGSTNAVLDVSI